MLNRKKAHLILNSRFLLKKQAKAMSRTLYHLLPIVSQPEVNK